jgi:trehalose 6-phosphate phosphatase
VTSALITEALAPLRSDPTGSAVLLDVDGTLAPIVDNAAEASVPEATRQLLIAISRRYGLLACVSGRRASDARAMVSIGPIAYVGSHGAELLNAGWTEAVLDPELRSWLPKVAEFRDELDPTDLQRRRIRVEDKGAILAFHWRGARDELAAREAIDHLAELAEQAGLEVHWGRKVMEARPPVAIDKGHGVATLLHGHSGIETVLYAGDDSTDLDAFRKLRELQEEGTIAQAVLVGVRSDDGPAEIEEQADLVVDGPTGMQSVLAALIPD